MAGETIITVVGNLTADPETRTLSSGGTVCNITIASTPRNYNRQTGQYEDGQPMFLRCAAWRDLAVHCAQTLHKGMRVIAQGRLQQRSYQAQDGSNRTVFEMQIDEIGPSLRYATAQVQRVQHGNGFQNNGGFQGGGNGYQGGTGYQPQQAQAPQSQSAPQRQTPSYSGGSQSQSQGSSGSGPGTGRRPSSGGLSSSTNTGGASPGWSVPTPSDGGTGLPGSDPGL